MKNINKVLLYGRLTSEPEAKTTSSVPLTTFSVATNYSWRDSSGSWKEGVDYHNVVAWRDVADRVIKSFHKGDLIVVEGKLQPRKWETKAGEVRRSVEVIAASVCLGDSPEGQAKLQPWIEQTDANLEQSS
jgi:single-strand DNA-binding protein